MRSNTVSMLSGALAFFVGREIYRTVKEYQKIKEMRAQNQKVKDMRMEGTLTRLDT